MDENETTEQVENMPREGKIVAVHSLDNLDYSVREIARILNIGTSTVQRYQKIKTSGEWSHIEHEIQKLMFSKVATLTAEVLKKVEEKLPDASFRELVIFFGMLRRMTPRVDLPFMDIDI